MRGDFVGVVSGIDLRDLQSMSQVAIIKSAISRYAVLVFPDQQVTDEQQLAFTRSFGLIEPAFGVPGDNVQAGRLSSEINDLSNLDRDNRILARDDRNRLYQLGNLLWHSDSSYKQTPAMYSLLSARAIPDRGGDTEFADMRAGWDTLNEETKQLVRPLVAEHSRLYSRRDLGFEFSAEEAKKFEPVKQRLVRRHPESKRLSLYLSSHAGSISEWLLPEARALLRELTEHATQSARTYVHRWQLHDLVMWDNRVTMHRGRRYPVDQVRDLRRTTTTDLGPTLQQPA